MRKRDILSLTAVIVGILWVFGSMAVAVVYNATTVNGLNANTPAQRSNPSEFSNAIREIKDVLRRVLPNDIVANATNAVSATTSTQATNAVTATNATNATTASQATNATTLGGYSGSAPNTNTPNTYAIYGSDGMLPIGAINSTFSGALVYNSGSQVASVAGLKFDSEEYDTDGYHSTVSNTGLFTIPSGVTSVIVSAFLNSATTLDDVGAIKKNGGTSYVGVPWIVDASGPGDNGALIQSPRLVVSPGDTFIINGMTGGETITGGYSTWFAIRKVE